RVAARAVAVAPAVMTAPAATIRLAIAVRAVEEWPTAVRRPCAIRGDVLSRAAPSVEARTDVAPDVPHHPGVPIGHGRGPRRSHHHHAGRFGDAERSPGVPVGIVVVGQPEAMSLF